MNDSNTNIELDICTDPSCSHPLARHDLHWGGCKYCVCSWLPQEGVKQVYANDIEELLTLIRAHGPPNDMPTPLWNGMVNVLKDVRRLLPEYLDEYH